MQHDAVNIAGTYFKIEMAGVEMLLPHDATATKALKRSRHHAIRGENAAGERYQRVLDSEAGCDRPGQIDAAGFLHCID